MLNEEALKTEIIRLREENKQLKESLTVAYELNSELEKVLYTAKEKAKVELENATEKIATQANLLRSVIDSTSDWIFVKDHNFCYVLVNQTFADAMGKTIDEFIGKNDLELGFPPELIFGDPEKGIKGFRADDQEVLTGKTLHNPYDRATDGTGKIMIFDTQKMPLKDSEGNIIGIIGMAKDVTERHEAEMKLKESNQVLELIFNTLPQRIFWKDRNFRFLGSNKLFAQDAGFESSGQIIGKDDFEMIWKDSAHLYRQDDEEIMTRGIAKINFDEQLILTTGETLWVRTSKIPLRNEKGEIIGMFGCYEDITERKKYQVTLKEQEQLLRSIYDGINHPIFVVDVLENGQFKQVGFNLAAEMTTGLKTEDIFNKTMEEILPPEQAKKISQDFKNCLKLGTSLSYEEYQKFQGQEEVWTFTTINPIKDDQGKIYRLVGTALNITDRKKAEELLRQSEERFRGLVETINDWIWEVDAHGVYTYISPQIESTLGYKPEEIIGKTPFNLMLEAEAKRVGEIFDQKAQNQQILKQIENINIHKDGYEVVMETSGVPVLDGEGNLIGYRGIDRDISDRKRQEQSLKLIVQGTASKTGVEFFRSCTQYLAQVLQVRHAVITEYKIPNHAKTLAFWSGGQFMDNFEYQLLGTPCAKLYEKHEKTGFFRCLKSVQSQFPEDEDLIRLEAESYAGISIKNNAGNLVGHIAVLDTQPMEQDLEMQSSILEIFAARAGAEIERMQAENALIESENKLRQQKQALEETLHQLQRTQTQLIQSEKMSSLGQLVAGVAHEINNPVNFIHGNISHADQYIEDLLRLQDMYKNYYPEPHADILYAMEEIDLDFLKEDLIKVFKSMRVGTERIREIVKSLRNFSRLDEAEFKPVNIHDGIDSTLMILQTRLREQSDRKEIQVIKEYGELPQIECYAGQLNQVFMNILSNAIDALEEGDRHDQSIIKIHTQIIENNFIAIIFNDNGSGIKSESISKLFDPFFTTKSVGQGTGLGLSISYQIVTERHKGKLYCNSQPGSTNFIIEIPIIQNR